MTTVTEVPRSDAKLRDGLALAFASFLPLCMSYLYFIHLRGTENDAGFIAFRIGKVIQFTFPALYVLRFHREQIGFPRPTWRGMPIGVAFGIAVGLSMWTLYYLWVRHIPAVAEKTPAMIFEVLQTMKSATPAGFLMMALFVCVPHSLGEEYYWRWFVFGWMRRYMPMPLAIVLSSAAFMLHHIVILGVYFPEHFWTLAMPFSVCVAIGGGVWCWIYDRSGSLYAPWLSHALIDGAIMVVGYVMLTEYWR